MAYSNTKIDYEYIISLIQNIVTPEDESVEITPEERQKKIDEAKQYVEELHKENPKVAAIMSDLIYEIEMDENKYKGQSILNTVENMKQECIEQVLRTFVWNGMRQRKMLCMRQHIIKTEKFQMKVSLRQMLIIHNIKSSRKRHCLNLSIMRS